MGLSLYESVWEFTGSASVQVTNANIPVGGAADGKGLAGAHVSFFFFLRAFSFLDVGFRLCFFFFFSKSFNEFDASSLFLFTRPDLGALVGKFYFIVRHLELYLR